MNPRSAITLAVRSLGLILAILALPATLRLVHEVIQSFFMGYGLALLSPFIQHDADEEPLNRIGWPVLFMLGLYLFLSGRWVIGRLLRGLDGTCPRCGYDTTAVTGPRCPECGTSLPKPSPPRSVH